jgi:NAD-dependent SIR2 family protein deacetylase
MSYRDQPSRQCAGKYTYRTKNEAKVAARRTMPLHGKMRAYRCPHCGSFHLGHSPEQRAVQQRRLERQADDY